MSPAPVVVNPELSAQAVLAGGLARYFGEPVAIARMEFDSFWADYEDRQIERVRVTLESGRELRVIFKRIGPGTGLHDYRREVLVYRKLLADPLFEAPGLYASVYDTATDRYWLFMEDLGDGSLDQGTLRDFLNAARWLARVHGTWVGRDAELRAMGCFVEHGSVFYQTLADTASANLDVGARPEQVRRFERLKARYACAVERLRQLPQTLLHGDFAPHNIAFREGHRIRPLDWEWAAVGPVGWDLVRLYYDWQSDKPRFFAAYADEFRRYSSVPFDQDAVARAFACSEVACKVWSLAMCPERFPQRGYVTRILDEMTRAAERMEALHA